ncbi:MAG: LUD domain-containing protein, partial [Spirochaetia bacterium]|nr:LUD domain-containing protein [Spirochaetia bacterium]
EAAAMDRIKNLAAPMNVMRLTTGAQCSKTGKCMHCKGYGTICCHTVITRYSRHPGRIKVLLVGEELGY